MVRFGISLPNYRVGYDVTYELIQKAAVSCEQLELDSGWVADHTIPHRGPRTPLFECFTLLSALARETKKIRLGTYVVSNTFRYPSLLAKMVTSLDHISGGRIDLAIGAGYNKIEHQRYGIPLYNYSKRIRQLKEGVEIVKRMFTEDAPSFKGEFYEIQDALNIPKSVQKPHIPIWIGGKGSRLLKVVAEYADWWQASASFSAHAFDLEALKEKSAELDGYIIEMGRKPQDVKRSFGLTFMIEKTEAAAKERMKKWDTLGKDACTTPDQWIERFRTFTDLGVSQFILSIPNPFAMFKDMELLADLVIPNL